MDRKSRLKLKKKNNVNSIQISPFVKSLVSGIKIPSDFNYKKEYLSFLEKKYQ